MTPYGRAWYTHAKPSIRQWKNHFEKNHLNEIKCDKCEFSAFSKVQLEKHKKVHLICDVCGMGPFKRPFQLKYHLETHKRNVS